MLPEAFADSTLMVLAFAIGTAAAFAVAALLVNFVLGLVLNLLVKLHESPLRSIEIRLIGALRVPVVMVIVLYGIRPVIDLAFARVHVLTGFRLKPRPIGAQRMDRRSRRYCLRYTISRLIRAVMRWYSARAPHDTRTALNTVIWPILIRITSIIVFTLGALVVLDIMGIPITPLLAGIGIGGIAVALAISPTIASFIAGTYVVAEGQISEGDYVEIDSERAGFVTNIGWRSTVLRSRFNNVIIVPNSLITASIVTNYTTPTPAVTAMVACGVSYDSNLREVERVCLEIAGEVFEESEAANTEFAPRIRFFEFADSNINFRIIFQGVDRVAMFAIQHEIIMRLHERFKEDGIEINYPVRKLTTALLDEYMPSPAREAGDLDGQAESVSSASATDD